MTKKFRDFKSAREFARSLKLKGVKEWTEYCKSGSKPEDITTNPHTTYKNKGWIRYGDWLGTGRVARKDMVFRDFKSAREFARSLKLTGGKEWVEFCKSGNKPDDIPRNPNQTYKNKGWVGMGDWLGTGRVATKDIQFRDFKSAREFARSLKLKNQKEWVEFCKSGNKPDDIPRNPDRTYKDKGWIGMGDWLGTGSVASKDRQFRDFESAREFARSLKLKNSKEWMEYGKSVEKPEDIPSNPKKVYAEWSGMGDWLGTGNIDTRTISKQYLSFKEAREEARDLAKQYNIKNWEDWKNAVKKGLIPKNIPANPWNTYSKSRKKKRE